MPVLADCGPPEGNVLLVAYPGVETDQTAGATSSAPTATARAVLRHCCSDATATVTAAGTATKIISRGTQTLVPS